MSTQVRIEQQSQASTQHAGERVAADSKLQEAFLRAMTRGSNRAPPESDALESQQRPQVVPWSATLSTPMMPHEAAGTTSPERAHDPELTALLERFSSQVYVAEGSRTSQPRVLLTLQGEAPGGSAAEVIREGAFLRVRLRAGSAATYERMQSRREMLVDALTEQGRRSNVIVEVVRDQGDGSGSAR